MNKILNINRIYLYGLALILVSPILVNVNFVFPFMQLKSVFFRLMVLVLLLIATFIVIKEKKIVLNKSVLMFSVLFFVFVGFLATFFSINPSLAFWGNYERMDGFINILFLGLFFLLLLIPKTKFEWLFLFRSSMITSICVIFYDYFFKLGLRIPGLMSGDGATLGNIDFLGTYLMLNFFVTIIAWTFEDNKKWKLFYLLVGLINFLTVFLVSARASILGLVAGLMLIVIFMYPKLERKAKKTIIFLVTIIFFGIVFLALFQDAPIIKDIKFVNRFADISWSDSSTANRLRVWQVASNAISKHFVLGWGPENAIYGLNEFYDPQITEPWFDRAHNLFLDYLLWGGILGLVSYLLIFISAFYLLFKNRLNNYKLSVALSGFLAAYLVNNLFSFDTFATWLLIFLILAFVSIINTSVKTDKSFTIPQFVINYDFLIVGFLAVIVIFIGYISVIRPAQANFLAADAIRYYQTSPEKSLNNLEKAIALNTFGTPEIAAQLADYSLSLIQKEGGDYLLKKNSLDLTEKYILEVLKNDPKYLKARLLLAQVYEAFAPYNVFYAKEAIRLIENNLNDSPNRLEMYTIMAQGYHLQGDFDGCVLMLQKVLALSSHRDIDYLNIINILSQKKDIEMMEKYINEYLMRFGNIPTENYVKLGQYYYRADLLDRAENLLKEEAIPRDPENFSPYIALASIYETKGDWQLAINYCNSIIEKYPKTKPQLEEYINYLKEKYNAK